MRILMICTEKLPVPPVRGGAIQTYIANVAPELARHHELYVLGVQDPDLPNRQRVGAVHHVRVEGGTFDVYARSVARYLKKESFDLIHIFNRPKLVARVRKWAPTARIILSMHNDMFEPHKITPAQAKRAIREVETIVTVSDYVGNRIVELYPRARTKLRTIYSGVDLARFSPRWSSTAEQTARRLRAEHNLGSGPVILFVGRLSPKKGADILVRAMGEIVRRHPDAQLVLVGSHWYGADRITDYVAYVRALAERSPGRVVTTGYVPADQVHEWFSVGDVFVCASQWQEPLARVHYEAMAAGLPIVTTARGGNPEVVRGAGNGVVVEEPENPSAFASAINRLLSSYRLRSEQGRRGRSLAEQQYGWPRVYQEILEVWERPA